MFKVQGKGLFKAIFSREDAKNAKKRINKKVFNLRGLRVLRGKKHIHHEEGIKTLGDLCERFELIMILNKVLEIGK